MCERQTVPPLLAHVALRRPATTSKEAASKVRREPEGPNVPCFYLMSFPFVAAVDDLTGAASCWKKANTGGDGEDGTRSW